MTLSPLLISSHRSMSTVSRLALEEDSILGAKRKRALGKKQTTKVRDAARPVLRCAGMAKKKKAGGGAPPDVTGWSQWEEELTALQAIYEDDFSFDERERKQYRIRVSHAASGDGAARVPGRVTHHEDRDGVVAAPRE